jgi:rubrerythrin
LSKIRSAAELYAHAIATEREAAARYAELAERMDALGQEAVAEVLGRLAQFEAEHLEALERRTRGMALPPVTAHAFHWFDGAAARMLTPRQALAAALEAEHRAHAFFEGVCMSAEDPALRALAREMALEESEHITLIEQLLGEQKELRP